MKKVRPIKRKWLDWLLNTNAMGKEPEILRNISRHFELKKKNGKETKWQNKQKQNKKKKQRKRKNTMKD